MEGGNSSDREREKPPEGDGGVGGGEPKVKRKMKTPSQLEVLERTYQVETYPSESLRADLSAQLGLSDRQLQMWFCHRRLKDRKMTTSSTPSSSSKRSKKVEGSPATSTPPVPPPSSSAAFAANDEDGCGVDLGNDHGSGSGSGSSPYRHLDIRRGGVPRTGVAVPRISHGRYYEPPQQPIAELRAIAHIEAQLGEPLREDGPALGIEFESLPPGAFGAPIGASGAQQKQAGRVYEHNLYERPDVKPIKGHGRALHEYQFLPEQPNVRGDSYERLAPSHYYGSSSDGPSSRAAAVTGGRASYMHGGEDILGYGYQGQGPSLSLMSQPGKHTHLLASAKDEFEGIPRKAPYASISLESPYSAHPITGLDGGSERRAIHEDEVVRVERKRKSEEARLQKEVEAHEKRMRKELEKQDMLRRKREEQMKKEMERHDRERRKEEERMLREKQREEERYQREQKREMERREKLLIKESIKAEKLKQKEELRREREAARQKAASDRAAARRIAKESMELIEDDRLELMEIATLKKGLPSILSLDSETLQCLDSFRDMLRIFPPKTVQLKRPFAVQPWIDSEENVGNLLMLWRFLITFADVLGLWPFTLDEIVQAFHDYDPRILGEIHIALLKTIIKDIEDVARTPSTGLGANQYSASNPSGGHPHIVEGAYAWGFDIRSWQCHLGPLTWPEILRQFALSAGFGPKLKKRNIEPAYVRDDHEGNDGKDIISNLRTGAAVENAVAIMQERGYSNTRKSRHRLTPGTVKFAAFHVLSLEGSNGLNILEVADRIQKSGLRDLTTSKTPEASIAAALSRDTKLFERVAPSTYCVRTPYRKDSADAEAILSAAREKIRIFKSGFVDGVEAEDVEKEDDVEKDDDSESDTAEDPEVDDLTADITQNKDSEPFYDINRPTEGKAYASRGVETAESNMASNCARNGLVNGGSEDIPIMGSGQGRGELNDPDSVSVDQSANGEPVEIVGITNQEDNDIDESYPGEPWVQGLMESDYSNLSVEERLGALVALIGVAVEGNSIRLVLEERLEAANALKKQMWAEAQLDKRRLKEEHIMKPQYSTFAGNTVDAGVANSATAENRQSPLINHEDKRNEAHMENDAQNEQKSNPEMLSEKNSANTELNFGQDNMSAQQSIYAAAERSRAQMKSYIGYKAEELYVYRSLPLGMDRRRNRYWQFVASASSNDPGSGRIFVELYSGSWRLIDSEEAFDALMASLDVRGVRESHLHALLQRIEVLFKETVKKQQATNTVKPKEESAKVIIFSGGASNPESGEDSPNSSICGSSSDVPEISSSFQIESGRNRVELKGILRRYKEFEEWMWKECYMSSILRADKHGKKRDTQLLGVCSSCHDLYLCEDNHCQSCHKTFSGSDKNFDFSDHSGRCDEMSKSNPIWARNDLDSLAPLRIRLLKAQLALVEASLPAEALQPFWSNGFRKSWATRLHVQSSADDLLQLLTVLEGAINKDFISSNFCKTADFLGSNDVSKFGVNSLNLGAINVLPWIPQTTAAVALRLMELDSALSYTLQQEQESRKDVESGDFMKPASKFTIVRSNKGIEPTGVDHTEFPPQDNWNDPASASFSYGRSKGGRGKGVRSRPTGAAATGSAGGRSQRRVSSGSRMTEPSRKSLVAAPSGGKLGAVLGGWKNRSARGRGGKKRSRRSTRSRQKPAKKEIVGPSSGGRSTNEFERSAVFDQTSHGVSVRGEEEEWTGDEEEEVPQMHEEMEAGGDGNGSNSERSVEEYDEDENENENENGQGAYVDDEYEDMEIEGGPYERAYRGKAPEASDDNVDDEDEEEEDEDDEDMVAVAGGANEYEQIRGGYTGNDEVYEQRDDRDEYEQDVDVGGYLNADSDDEDNNDDGRYGIMGRQGPSNNWNRGGDSGSGSGSGSGSTDYSD